MSTASEQRRWPRVKADGCYLRLLVEIPVCVRELSAGGALLEAPAPIAAGSEAQLQTRLEGRPFTPEVLVCRTEEPVNGASRGHLAVKFDSMDETTRTALAEFLKTAAEPAT